MIITALLKSRHVPVTLTDFIRCTTTLVITWTTSAFTSGAVELLRCLHESLLVTRNFSTHVVVVRCTLESVIDNFAVAATGTIAILLNSLLEKRDRLTSTPSTSTLGRTRRKPSFNVSPAVLQLWVWLCSWSARASSARLGCSGFFSSFQSLPFFLLVGCSFCRGSSTTHSATLAAWLETVLRIRSLVRMRQSVNLFATSVPPWLCCLLGGCCRSLLRRLLNVFAGLFDRCRSLTCLALLRSS